MRIIGLTGGIGSGKSTVSSYLKDRGYEIVDADKIARQVTDIGSPVLAELKDAFGGEIFLPDGALDRKRLGSMVFSDAEKKERLDEITHREICARIETAVREFGGTVIFLDVPLLYETGMESLTDEVWVVDVEDDVRIRRVMERDGLSKQEVLNRIAGQLPREEKLKRADRVLSNSGTQEELYKQIEQLIGELR